MSTRPTTDCTKYPAGLTDSSATPMAEPPLSALPKLVRPNTRPRNAPTPGPMTTAPMHTGTARKDTLNGPSGR